MKNKTLLIVILLGLILLIGGASLLYSKLGQDAAPEQLALNTPATPTAPAATPTEEITAETETPAKAEPTPAKTPESETERPKTLAPDFRVYDKDGNTVQLSDFFGKPIVLNFWASWCGPCRSEMPGFNQKYSELGSELNFVMVNMTDGARETVDTALAYVAQNGYDFPVLFDTDSEAALNYSAYSLPMTYFINAQGEVIAQAVGAIDPATLQKGIDMITE